ncbi:hypothetical protein D9619_001586 [Psilocybe cf. subviscida]|uniref:F-box domain-containing protein n=1 Tax=Psilocybe cf. subviscida TaxID=2480587 RepID=A0A8H5BHE3_9AGAR|nr:hypothetical protein D9619_001586 [Psilocybe cf. subviscida]
MQISPLLPIKRTCELISENSPASMPTQPAHFRSPFSDLPFDILAPILAQLTDRRDWHTCTFVSKAFCRAATPLLYRTLDSRIISKTLIHHPSTTLLRRPHLANYVRHITETGTIHRAMHSRYPNITQDTLAAMALCKNLRSITWVDDSSATDDTILAFIDVVRRLPLRELTIRTHNDLGESVWSQINTLIGLQKVSIWCMEGPPRVLQGWSAALGATLTHLELGRCAGVPSTVVITVISQLPLLKDLRLKGAPATSISTILTYLPALESLDTEYLVSGSASYYTPRRLYRPVGNGSDDSDDSDLYEEEEVPFPTLRQLTVRTSSMDISGPQKLWMWIRELVPRPGLETFQLHAFTFNMGYTGIPRMFILDLADKHGGTLKNFIAGEAHLTLKDIECLCNKFPKLETLNCSVASSDVASITEAISSAQNLHTLKLQVQWIPTEDTQMTSIYNQNSRYQLHDANSTDADSRFTLEDAKNMMRRSEDSKLRTIVIGHVKYTGRWEFRESESEIGGKTSTIELVVSADLAEDRWKR